MYMYFNFTGASFTAELLKLAWNDTPILLSSYRQPKAFHVMEANLLSTDTCIIIIIIIIIITKRLCTEYVDPRGLEAILANRLIPLDKGEGAVRPIGVGEVLRRIIGKCVAKVTKPDVIDASGSLQVCAGHKSGSEAAIHAMRQLFWTWKQRRRSAYRRVERLQLLEQSRRPA